MSLNDYKITQGDIASKGVQAAPDVLSGSPAENKAIFDRLISEAVAVQFNALIDKLVENGAEAILRRGDDSVLYLRINADKVLEVSTDGKEYFSTVGSGHIIVDKYGKDMPKGLRLKFDNFEVREENGTIIVHGVAEEIAGAIPNTEKGAAGGVATLDAEGKVPNAQLPSVADYGAAPAGYGLGYAQNVSVDELGNITAPGFYFISGRMTADNITANYWHMYVSAYGNGSINCVQTLYPVYGDYSCEIVRRKVSGEWLPWECDNPPMSLGVEYRTTERYIGKPVYVKCVSIGALPNASSVAIENIPCIDRETLVSSKGIAVSSDGKITYAFPYRTASDSNGFGSIDLALRTIGTQSISGYITTTTDKSSFTGYLIIKYTKSTD